MANVNILEGMQCPQCGSEGPFKISATSRFTVYDDGADDHEDVEWDDDSACQCEDCDHEGTVKDFTINLDLIDARNLLTEIRRLLVIMCPGPDRQYERDQRHEKITLIDTFLDKKEAAA